VEQGQPIAIPAVDDESGVLALVRRCLDHACDTLIEASSGHDALEHIAKSPALDLLITDLRMPEMEGDEAKPQLSAEEAYLDKPFTREGLQEAVALLLYSRTKL
jgi:CheY-like chemotaxis protein